MNRIESLFNTTANLAWGLFAKKQTYQQPVKLIAHRGVHENYLARENSREAFELSIENQIWGIEFDVRWTKDDIPVIHHDADCQRIYNYANVIGLSTFPELKAVAPDMLSLEEVILKYSSKIVLMIELKESLQGHPARSEKLEKLLSRLIPRKHFYLLALDPAILESVSFVTKKAMMNVAWADMASTLKKTLVFGHGAVSGHFLLLNARRLAECRQNGIMTGTGFIETEGALFRELNRGVDFIFTNHPIRLKSFLQSP